MARFSMRPFLKIQRLQFLACLLGFLGCNSGLAQTNVYLYTGAETNITLSPGVYYVTAYGAEGGQNHTVYFYGGGGIFTGGGSSGAEMSAEFNFPTQTTLTLLVGAAGTNGDDDYGDIASGGGGGGGSFVVNGSMPLLIAGGGGGEGGGAGYNGNTGTAGDNGAGGYPNYPGAGGTDGSGGTSAAGRSGGGGGGGFSGDGSGGSGQLGGGGGLSFLHGSAGGGGATYFTGGGGGYGGGGGGGIPEDPDGEFGGGGGGGYSGGGGGSGEDPYYIGAGGGGGSYIDASAIEDLTEISGVASPDDSPNGEIIIYEYFAPSNIFIQTQPSSQSVPVGATATFSVVAFNSDPLSYQWLFNGTNISGATNATFSISEVNSNCDGNYSVIVSDAVTNVVSSNALLTVVYPPPFIILQPASRTVINGSNVVFSVDATNYDSLNFQWLFNGTNLTDGGQISGSASSNLVISSAQAANDGPYQVIVSDSFGTVTSSIASLTVDYPIQITGQPASESLLEGSNATFTVTATGPISGYQWYFDGTPLTDGGNVTGSMSATLTLANIQNNNSGNYAVVVTNNFFSSVSSNATLFVINPVPVIVSPPANLAVISGSNAVFSVFATNYFPLGFQWQFNGTNLTDGGQISGSTSSNLMISGAQTANAGPYQVIVFDDYSAVTSSVASLTVYAPPQIVGEPTNETALSGSNISFTVTATGNPLNYQWFCNGIALTNGGNISGSTNSTLTITSVQTNNDGVYWASVTSLTSIEVSSNAALTVYNPAQIVTQPANAGVLLGSNISFTASATGTAISYQWYFEGMPLADNGHVTGSSTPTLSITNIGNSDGGDYQVLVTNLLSSAMSRLATLTPLTNLAPSIRYVNVSNSTPASPYLSWSTAATQIEDAVNASLAGDQVVVTDGVYQTGGDESIDFASNRVLVTFPISIQSVNGSAATVINGGQVMRCVYLTNGATLTGFTLTNGYPPGAAGFGGGAYCTSSTNVFISNCLFINNVASFDGGGVFSGNLKNCTIVGNVAKALGGGAFESVLNNCILTGNSGTNNVNSRGGGGFNCTFNNCYLNNNSSGLGGGAYSSTLNNCTVSNNVVIGNPPNSGEGGGVYGCTVQNSLIVSNTAQWGGGAYNSPMSNCVIQGNHAQAGGGVIVESPSNAGLSHCALIGNWASAGGGFGSGGGRPILTNCLISGNWAGSYGGVINAQLLNCSVISNAATNSYGGIYSCPADNSIVYYNIAPQYPNGGGTIYATNCCFGQDVTSGTGFFTNAPLFVNLAGGDFHLQSNSPCINAGTNAYVTTATDLDGNPRIVGGTVDIGAYEYQSPVSMVSYYWLEQYGLAPTNNVDTSDPDGTGFDVYQDWIAGLNPTNPASVLAMVPVVTTNTVSGITVKWQSVSGVLYNLQRSTNLFAQPPFSTIQSNVTGLAGTTSYKDTTATNSLPYFYRVGVP